ncbi:DUF1963 domain-containing protein [Sphingomonas sp. ASV193]|uniref:DUF1963 domain-containing protein n=1 Tax=Sphingomonas sp. ASV193 TaxID=3144405 RepID=UPI0032E8651B
MTMILVGGAVALVVVLAAFALMRRKSPEAPVETVEAEPMRRRAVGATLIADEAAAPVAEPVAPVRESRSIGLTPWSGDERAAEEVVPEAEEEAGEDETPWTEPPRPEPLPEPTPESALAPSPDAGVEEDFPPDPVTPVAAAGGDEPPSILSQLAKKKKGGGANPLAGAIEDAAGGVAGPAPGAATYAESAPPPPREVEESVSVVLRRQVPPRLDEAPRSWLGGRPMMPAEVEWPRSVQPDDPAAGPVPLNFVAQVACEDLPAELWGGVGPRTGWLLFFLNPRDEAGDDERIFRAIHVPVLGEERAPPADLPPVAVEGFGGGDWPFVRPGDIPGEWRRWPVDLVEMPNEAFDDGYRIVVTPKDYASALYEGAPVEGQAPDLSDVAPFSWRGALYAVDAVLRRLDDPAEAPQPLGPGLREALGREGFVAALVPEMRAREARWLSEGEGAILSKEEPLTARERERREAIAPVAAARHAAVERLAGFINQYPGAAAIAARIDDDAAKEAAWRSSAAGRLGQIREAILAHELDSPLSDEDWTALAAHLDADRFEGWSAGWTSRNSDFPVSLDYRALSLLDLARRGIGAATAELVADYYLDPARRHLLPEGVAERMEPHWRALVENRPIRMGGFHDGIQSDPEPGPQAEVLLLQVASDDAMRWMWGDAGAYYAFISPYDLGTGNLGAARIQLEQP